MPTRNFRQSAVGDVISPSIEIGFSEIFHTNECIKIEVKQGRNCANQIHATFHEWFAQVRTLRNLSIIAWFVVKAHSTHRHNGQAVRHKHPKERAYVQVNGPCSNRGASGSSTPDHRKVQEAMKIVRIKDIADTVREVRCPRGGFTSFRALLEFFSQLHDPTTPPR